MTCGNTTQIIGVTEQSMCAYFLEMKAPLACLTGTAPVQIANAMASSIENDMLLADKLMDGDWGTRWSSNTDQTQGQTVILDLGETKSLASIELWW